ncbi:hypothetical protein KOR42_34590 [Thalassoglobus neptunius]|uniref:Uncharacterized protein n=1 Tax=Thalassoglobus neptunius TaxID=1938619 RepID=A0A5C5WN93_9PLAN|nr:hypothetical protein [Thalassoglobus neptunius]TWT51571.1 hypothetical protein KOR42_34590 [Thalassoglobus neptunius]
MQGKVSQSTSWHRDWRGQVLTGVATLGLLLGCLSYFDHITIQGVVLFSVETIFVFGGSLIGMLLVQSALNQQQFFTDEQFAEIHSIEKSSLPDSADPRTSEASAEADPFIEILRRRNSQKRAA